MHTILHVRTVDGRTVEIGPGHPEYVRLLEEYRKKNPHPPLSVTNMLGYAALCLSGGCGIFGYIWQHALSTRRLDFRLEMIAAISTVLGFIFLPMPFLPSRLLNGPAQGWEKGVLIAVIFVPSGFALWFFHHWLMSQL